MIEKAGLTSDQTEHLRFLDGMRGIAAVYVVFCHFCLGWDSDSVSLVTKCVTAWTNLGHVAVAMFIVLSGFSLMLPVATAGTLKGGTSGYLFRRANRILPAYYAALVLSILALVVARDPTVPEQVNFGTVISHVLMIHNIRTDWVMTINAPLWSVATEWQIYFVFPFILLPIWKRSGALAVVVSGCAFGPLLHAASHSAGNIDCARPWLLALFCMGVAAASMVSRPTCLKIKRWQSISALCVLVLVYSVARLCTMNHNGVYMWIVRDYLIGAACALLICHCYIYKESLVRAALSSWVVGFLGAFSYSIYLSHWAVVHAWLRIEGCYGLNPNAAILLRMLVGVPTSVVIAYVFYLCFERPFLTTKARQAVLPLTRNTSVCTRVDQGRAIKL